MKTENDQLEAVLKQARVPARSAGYWEYFPRRVMQAVDGAEPPDHPARWIAAPHWLTVAAGALVCAILIAGIQIGRGRSERADGMQSYAKLYRQIEAMFPHQVRAIVVDARGVSLILAETADVPRSHPLLVRACGAHDCRHIITFSGQQITVNGDPWDILINGQNRVIVAGRSTDRYRIAAERLGGV